MNQKQLNQIKSIAQDHFQKASSSHDLSHTKRVVKLVKLLAKEEGVDIDIKILESAAWLHDIGRTAEDTASHTKNYEFKVDHATIGAQQAEQILISLAVPESEKKLIVDAILTHRYRKKDPNTKPSSMVGKILYDADKLDSIGAIGIARAYSYAGENNYQLYSDVFENRESMEGYNGLNKDSTKHTPYIEYKVKLSKITDTLFTKKAIELGETRHNYMKKFFETLYQEIHCLE